MNERVAKAGAAAWCRLKKNRTWQDWVAVGRAVVVIRGSAMKAAKTDRPFGPVYNHHFARLLKRYKMDDMDTGDRARLYTVMSKLKEIEKFRATLSESDRLRLNHPNALLRHYEASVGGVPVEKQILREAKDIRDRLLAANRLKTIARNQATNRNNTLLPADQCYSLLLLDPPWKTGLSDRAPDNHYPTMMPDEIAKLPVGEIGAKNSVCFLWTTSAILPEALACLEAWGFEYKSHCVWIKEGGFGLGVYWRNQHELLLLATRGNILAPAVQNRPCSVITAPRGRHSEKPAASYEMIESMYPEYADDRIELFARRARPGWAVWGNEVPRAGSQSQRPRLRVVA
jgi:N6-adenosine-specific RNA methylase IME4